MNNVLTCKVCGREIIGVENLYGKTWTCSTCYLDKDPYEVLGCERGSKIRFVYPENGMECDQEKAAKYLLKGETYTVESLIIGSWSSDVILKEFPGVTFNTVLFKRSPRGLRRKRIHVEEAAMMKLESELPF